MEEEGGKARGGGEEKKRENSTQHPRWVGRKKRTHLPTKLKTIKKRKKKKKGGKRRGKNLRGKLPGSQILPAPGGGGGAELLESEQPQQDGDMMLLWCEVLVA